MDYMWIYIKRETHGVASLSGVYGYYLIINLYIMLLTVIITTGSVIFAIVVIVSVDVV